MRLPDSLGIVLEQRDVIPIHDAVKGAGLNAKCLADVTDIGPCQISLNNRWLTIAFGALFGSSGNALRVYLSPFILLANFSLGFLGMMLSFHWMRVFCMPI